MNRLLVLALAATAAFATPTVAKWPPWISIESPVNPYDPGAQGALLLVHATFREGESQVKDVGGTAEGLVDGARRSIPLHFEATGRPNTYALRRQWPVPGAWLARIAVRGTTAIVTFDRAGNVASIQVPTELTATHDPVPRAVSSREIDSTLARLARQ